MISALVDVPVALLLLAVASGAGAGLLRLARVQPAGLIERWALSLALGFAFVGYLLFGLGVGGWADLRAVWVALGLTLALGTPVWLDIVRWLRGGANASRIKSALGRQRRIPYVMVFGGLIAALALMNLIGALAPPTEADSLDHHLSVVRYFIDQGQITFVPYRTWQAPFTAEMWNMLGLLLGSDQLPQLFQWGMGLAGAAALYVLAATRTSRRTALLAAAIFYTSPHIFQMSSSAKNDLAWLMFLFLGFHALLVWWESRELRWLWLSAILVGLTVGTKYHGLFWAPAIGLALIAVQASDWRQNPLRAVARSSAFAGIAALLAVPWWLHNWLASRDPVWPYGYPVLQSRFWSQELHDKYAAYTQGPGDSIWHFLAGPWNLTVNQSAWLFGLRLPITPLLVALIPGLLLAWPHIPPRTRRFLGLVVVPAFVYYTFWFVTYQQPRYLLPSLGLLMIPAAYAFWKLLRFHWPGIAARGIVGLSLLAFLGFSVAFNAQFVPVVLGLESREEFLSSKVSFYNDMQWVNGELPADARLLFYHLKPFYLERDYLRGDRNLWPVDQDTTAEEYMRLLEERGITHVFVGGETSGDSEFDQTRRVLTELKRSGELARVYFNPEGVSVLSRTLSQSELLPVEILEVVRAPVVDQGR